MKSNLLHIETSPRFGRSQSRGLGADFIAAWTASHPSGTITTLDLTKNPVPFVSSPWVEGAFTAPEGHSPEAKAAMEVSNGYVNQLLAADQILITTPMYNLSIPAALKAWIDQIVRVGRTFSMDPETHAFKGLATGKKVTIVVSSGSDFRPGTPAAGYNFAEPYLRAILGFIGLTDVTFAYGHSMNLPDPAKSQVLAEARKELQALAVA
jgi:FMN-dependent NADH-azoreductase